MLLLNSDINWPVYSAKYEAVSLEATNSGCRNRDVFRADEVFVGESDYEAAAAH
jgi:hypothetical protein